MDPREPLLRALGADPQLLRTYAPKNYAKDRAGDEHYQRRLQRARAVPLAEATPEVGGGAAAGPHRRRRAAPPRRRTQPHILCRLP